LTGFNGSGNCRSSAGAVSIDELLDRRWHIARLQVAADRSPKKLNVWLFNLEDDMIELRRRVSAAMIHYNIKL
jgi:hypothetical protein